jgi:predicted lipoprotein with Yx(FWY)xxD motif
MTRQKTRRTARSLTLPALAGACCLVLATTALAAPSTVVSTKHTSLGTILVTGFGQTLYLDTADRTGHFACTGSCLKTWPPLKASGALKAPGSAKASLLGEAKGPAGLVVTYAGHPLYTFASDTTSNPTSGEGIHGFYAVSAAGTKVSMPPSHIKPKPASGAPGY